MSADPRQAADRYFDAVNAGDLHALEAVFSDDAVLEHPAGTFRGRVAIGQFYREAILSLQTQLATTTTTVEGTRCVAEFEGRSPLGEEIVHACDVFEVDGAGRVVSLHIYIR